MKHASSRAVYAYWNDRRGDRPAPTRADIDPAAIRRALGDTFLLSTDFADQLRIRLAGTRICALFCREIKGEILTELWGEKSRNQIEDIFGLVSGEQAAVVTGLTGRAADGASAELELLLLPLAHNGTRTGILGVLAPTEPLYWIGSKPLEEIELNTVRHLGHEVAGGNSPGLVPAAATVEIRHGFAVYRGGRDDVSSEQSA
jgi:hypothetical protein